MTDKNLSQRLDRIEDLLSDEPRPGELSPGLQDMVNRVLQHGQVKKEATEAEHDGPTR